MPYNKLEDANPAIRGIDPPVSLEDANEIAAQADVIGGEYAWPTAISSFKKTHKVVNGHWVKKSSKKFSFSNGALISDEVNNKLNLIVQKLFWANRIMDRGISVLDVEYLMVKTVSIIHPLIAHRYGLIADRISDFQGDRNCLTIYGDTPTDASEYNSVPEFFDKMVEYQIELESLVYEVREFAKEQNDFMTQVFLDSFMLSLIPLTKQMLLLSDKAHAYENNCQDFDSRVEDWIILKPL